jgi:hypothetical protein
MAFGTTSSQGSGGENITHFGGIRMRVYGSGNLRMSFISMDRIFTSILVPFVMASSTNIQPTRLGNFVQQRALLRGETTAINEKFTITRIIIYVREIYKSYPG